MTTGSKTYDYRTPFTNPFSSSDLFLGRVRTVTWSGPGGVKLSAPGKPKRESIPPLADVVFEPVFDKKTGQFVYRKVSGPTKLERDARREAVRVRGQREQAAKKKPRRKIVRAPNNYTKSVTDITVNSYKWSRKASPGDLGITGVAGNYGFTDSHIAIDPAQEYKLLAKLRAKAYGSGFHPGIFAAEMPQTLGMIRDSATRLRNGMLHAALGDWRGVVRNFGNVWTPEQTRQIRNTFVNYNQGRILLSHLWLEIQYGWKPLLGDLESAAAYMAEQLNGGASALSRRIAATREFSATSYQQPGSWMYYSRRDTVTRLRYVITNLTCAPLTAVPSLASVAGVAWEKLPYSFVCDWVVPISDYLAALRTAADLKGTVVRSCKQTTTYSEVKYNSGTWNVGPVPMSPYGEARTFMTFTRTVSQEINPPVPLRDLSPSSIITSLERAANAVALLQNLRFDPKDRVGILKLLGKTS